MALGVLAGAAVGRRATAFDLAATGPPLAPWDAEPGEGALSPQESRCPELHCVRSRLGPALLAAAERRAARTGVGADRVLITGGLIDEEDYLHALGEWLGVGFEPLDGIERGCCPIDDARLIGTLATGILPLTDGDDFAFVVTPRGMAAHNLTRMIEANPAMARCFRFTTAERLNRLILRHAGKALTAQATDRLQQQWPALSAAPPRRRTFTMALALAGFSAIAASALMPLAAAEILSALMTVVFLGWQGLRIAGAFVRPRPVAHQPALTDAALPVYSVIAALYREAASVKGLLAAIEQLDYPPEKLDIILAVEADDRDTRAAIAARASRVPITVVAVPPGGPRTKPKALNFALPFARGTFTVIYDAEDRPEPAQLREALEAFRDGGERLACVQAPLSIDNTADSWLARLFTAEYAGHFDVFLPGLSAFRLPLPLGGSSNHFRTASLRALAAWDPYNVTEDADLGMRLARFGYCAGTIGATTYEEAPTRLGPWLRQRTRWFKGWMQTWLVHMRAPAKLWRDLGPAGFFGFQLIVGGSAFFALVHPLFLAALIDDAFGGTLTRLYFATAVAGYLASAVLGFIGLKRRRLTRIVWVLLLTPLHWLLLSIAAWRALYQLIFAPYAWEKTQHGLAKSSRRSGAGLIESLLALERHLSKMQERGELPVIRI
jgi:cellulose synthase/poly-beta-1,6-N-acetylglucosamine synthase-like glycosyltransferase